MAVQPEWTLNMPQLIEVGTFLLTLIVLHTTNVRRLQKIETRVEMIYEWFMRHIVDGKPRREGLE